MPVHQVLYALDPYHCMTPGFSDIKPLCGTSSHIFCSHRHVSWPPKRISKCWFTRSRRYPHDIHLEWLVNVGYNPTIWVCLKIRHPQISSFILIFPTGPLRGLIFRQTQQTKNQRWWTTSPIVNPLFSHLMVWSKISYHVFFFQVPLQLPFQKSLSTPIPKMLSKFPIISCFISPPTLYRKIQPLLKQRHDAKAPLTIPEAFGFPPSRCSNHALGGLTGSGFRVRMKAGVSWPPKKIGHLMMGKNDGYDMVMIWLWYGYDMVIIWVIIWGIFGGLHKWR